MYYLLAKELCDLALISNCHMDYLNRGLQDRGFLQFLFNKWLPLFTVFELLINIS